MEFLQLILALVAIVLIWFKPRSENWAFTIMWAGWLLMMFFYVGHTSSAWFGNINL